MTLSVKDRLVINAAVDKLLKANCFDEELCNVIAHLLPVPMKQTYFKFKCSYSSNSSHAGHAAGIGDVKIDDKEETKEFSFGGDEFIRAGNYKIHRGRRVIEIYNFQYETDSEDQPYIEIDLDQHGNAIGINQQVPVTYSFWKFQLTSFVTKEIPACTKQLGE